MMKRPSFFFFFGVSSEVLVGRHRSIQLKLFKHYWLGHRLGLLWHWMVALERNRDHSVIFIIATNYCTLDSFCDYEGYSIFSQGFLPSIVDTVVIWIKFTHSSPFNSLIPKMSMFTFAISCLTTSNLFYFIDPTFQVPMQYCSLQHQTLLPSPVTTTPGCCFALALSLHSFWSYFSTDLQ